MKLPKPEVYVPNFYHKSKLGGPKIYFSLNLFKDNGKIHKEGSVPHTQVNPLLRDEPKSSPKRIQLDYKPTFQRLLISETGIPTACMALPLLKSEGKTHHIPYSLE
jgi:hypothetical protein